MGFRSKMMTGDWGGIKLPEWFISKHQELYIHDGELSLASRVERKFYDPFKDEELFTDIQKVLQETETTFIVTVVLLHECGGITLVHITDHNISGREPTEWKEVDQVTHNYCYGCSKGKIE